MRYAYSLPAFVTVLVLATTFSPAATSIKNLRCENKTSPLGIDILHPRLSWQMQSDQRSQTQFAYRLLIATTPNQLQSNTADIWDTGKITSDQSINIEYAGPLLQSAQTCYWKVIVWNQDNQQFASDTTTWEMGFLQPTDWKAHWIDFPAAQHVAPTTRPATTSPTKPVAPFTAPSYLHKSYSITKPIKRARLYASALGLYECSINDQRIGDTVLAPDWTDYHKRVEYQTYDITPLLHQGENNLGAILADGWYSGKVGWLTGHAYGQRPAFLAQLVIDYTDGTQETIATDQTWTASEGPILRADLLDGEDYDARADWNESAPVSLRPESPLLQASIAPPVRQLRKLAAKKITEPAPGRFTFDLGQNMVGVARLKVTGPAGTKITLRFAEMLNPDGTIYTDNLRNARVTDSYILRGGGEEIWQPQFTFHGFRYVEVTGYPGTPTADAITGIVIGSDNPSSGSWECSNPLLNQLLSNIVWGQRGNYISVPTDCPQRDERLGWMGDAQVFVRTATCNADVHAFFDHWLQDVSDAQTADGAFTDISPHVAGAVGSAAWADAGVICPWTIYQVYDDPRLIRRQYDSMAKYIEYLRKNSSGLIRPAKGYGDWLSIAADTPKDVLATAYFANSTRLVSKMAKIIGKDDDAAKYEQLFQDIRKAFNEKFVAADGTIHGDTQTCYLLALKFDLLDESKRADAARRLVADIKAKNWHLSTGFVGVSYLLPILTQYGYTDVAYRLLNQDTFPSWLFSVKQGATTIWERWDGWTPDKGFQTPKMNSFNHYSLGSCGQWVYDTIAGIGMDPAVPGFKHIIIHPQPGGGLTWARASYESNYGPIKTDWKITGDALTLTIDIPANTTADVYVPGSDVTSDDAKMVRQQDDSALFQVQSGSYLFHSKVIQK
jgi:alpha-L-rhamnosidase